MKKSLFIGEDEWFVTKKGYIDVNKKNGQVLVIV